jgi:hypothetical protein
MSSEDLGHPGLWLRCAEDSHAAYSRDLEGHKLCFIHTFEGDAGC